MFFFFFKQKTAYEMRISDWSSDVCSSDLTDLSLVGQAPAGTAMVRVNLFLASAGSNVPLANSEAATDAWAVCTASTQAAAEAGVAGGDGAYPHTFMTVKRSLNGHVKPHTTGPARATTEERPVRKRDPQP